MVVVAKARRGDFVSSVVQDYPQKHRCLHLGDKEKNKSHQQDYVFLEPDVVEQTCNPSTQEARVHSHPGLHREFQAAKVRQ